MSWAWCPSRSTRLAMVRLLRTAARAGASVATYPCTRTACACACACVLALARACECVRALQCWPAARWTTMSTCLTCPAAAWCARSRQVQVSAAMAAARGVPHAPPHLPRLLHALRAVEAWTVAFSPDGRSLATGSLSGAINLWNPDAGESMARIETRGKFAMSVAFVGVRGRFRAIAALLWACLRCWPIGTLPVTERPLAGQRAPRRRGARVRLGDQPRAAQAHMCVHACMRAGDRASERVDPRTHVLLRALLPAR